MMKEKMRILISNDDGYTSDGLKYLKEELSSFSEVVSIAPARDKSGSGSSLSLRKNIEVREIGDNEYIVYGTPADCVHLGINGIYQKDYFDMVVSGVNEGHNLGDAARYSGTVGAAVEGRRLKYPPIAFSVVNRNPSFIKDACSIAKEIVLWMVDYYNLSYKHERHTAFFNVNIPNLPKEGIKGVVCTSCGEVEAPTRCVIIGEGTEKGVCLGKLGKEKANKFSDFHAIRNNKVSITPLSINLTDNYQNYMLDRHILEHNFVLAPKLNEDTRE